MDGGAVVIPARNVHAVCPRDANVAGPGEGTLIGNRKVAIQKWPAKHKSVGLQIEQEPETH